MPSVTADPYEDPVQFAWQGLTAAFAGTPTEQMVASVILGVFAWVATFLSLGVTAVLVVLFTVTFFIGVTRYTYARLRGWSG